MNDMHIMARILAAVRANEGNLVFNTSLVDEKVIKTDAKTVERCTIFSGSFKRNSSLKLFIVQLITFSLQKTLPSMDFLYQKSVSVLLLV